MEVDTTTANGLLQTRASRDPEGSLRKCHRIARSSEAASTGSGHGSRTELSVAYAMSGELKEAAEEVQTLFTYAQSTTYTLLATKHLAVAVSRSQLEQTENPAQRSIAVSDIASFYWNLGYDGAGKLAVMLKSELEWIPPILPDCSGAGITGCNEVTRRKAKAYLRNLVRIDGTNPIVQQFTLIDRNEDFLSRRTIDPKRL